MAVVNLSFAATRAAVKVSREAMAVDPLFAPDKTGPARSAETLVFDSWGYQVRDFPCLVIQGMPGKNRRMGIGGDVVRPFFGVPLFEEPGGTANLRTFDVPLALVVDKPGDGISSVLDLRYTGDATGMNPQPPFRLPVKQKTVGPNVINYVELAGPAIGPAATFPLKNFEASVKNYSTGQVFGGWYDMTLEVSGCCRNQQTRSLLADRIQSLFWFEKKKALRKLGIVVLDVTFAGFTQFPYGADQLYQTKFNVAIATEFEAIVQYTETVTDISVVGTAASTL